MAANDIILSNVFLWHKDTIHFLKSKKNFYYLEMNGGNIVNSEESLPIVLFFLITKL